MILYYIYVLKVLIVRAFFPAAFKWAKNMARLIRSPPSRWDDLPILRRKFSPIYAVVWNMENHRKTIGSGWWFGTFFVIFPFSWKCHDPN